MKRTGIYHSLELNGYRKKSIVRSEKQKKEKEEEEEKSCRISVCECVCYPMYSWIAHLIVTFMWNPIAFNRKTRAEKRTSIYYTAASVGIYCVLVVECDCEWTKKKTCHRKKGIVSKFNGMKKKLKNHLEIYGMPMLLKSPIVYRICAPARKHVNQLNSTRFPNVIKKNRECWFAHNSSKNNNTNDNSKKSSVRHANMARCILLSL